jgi:hypothetical protein
MRTVGRRSGGDAKKAHLSPGLTLGIAVAMFFALAGNSEGQSHSGGQSHGKGQSNNFCSQTARTLFTACGFEVKDDSFVKKAICINISDADEREECLDELEDEREEGNQLCKEQREGRLDACESLGEDRYDPDFDPALFDDPKSPTNPNPYFPLTVGNEWEYRSETEVNTVEVLNETKLIDGVTCIVSHDLVFDEDGFVIEDTDDWFVPAKDGNTWYCGEEVKDFETFQGDNPVIEELVSIDGSFKAGVDGAKPGIIFPASPQVGDVYLEEFSLGNAEDFAEVVSTTYAYGKDPELDQLVPQELAEHFCSDENCVVTNNISLLSPGIIERKYYALGVGFWLEVVPDTKEVVQLVKCNVDPVLCINVPQP